MIFIRIGDPGGAFFKTSRCRWPSFQAPAASRPSVQHWIALISLQMDVQSDNISIGDSFMDDDSQAGMFLEHPFNALDKAGRPVFGHLRIVLGVGKSDVSASRFGRLFLVYGEFIERCYELFVFFFYGLRCQNYLQTARFERD